MKQTSIKRMLSLLLAVVLLLSLSPQLSAAEAPQDGLNELVGPDEEVLEEITYSGTRVGCALMLYHMAGEPEVDLSFLDKFTDLGGCTETELAAIAFVLNNGIMSGVAASSFGPYQSIAKSLAITFIWIYYGKPQPSVTENPFTDVINGKFYYSAVLWATENIDWLESYEPGSNLFEPSRVVEYLKLFRCREPDASEIWKLKIGTDVLPLPTSGVCGDDLTWSFDADTGMLAIEGSGAMTNYSYATSPWKAFKENLVSVALPEGLTSIGDYAFSGCIGLSSVNIPESVSSIGSNAFYNCSSLCKVAIYHPSCSIGEDRTTLGMAGTTVLLGSVGSTTEAYAQQYSYTFVPFGTVLQGGNCGAEGDNLTWTLDFETGLLSITGSGAMQDYSDSHSPWKPYQSEISFVELPGGLTSIGGNAFYGCKALTTVTIPEGVTSIGGYAFYGCTGLIEIAIPASVSEVFAFVFNNCDTLKTMLFAGSNTYITTLIWDTEETAEDLTLTESGRNMLGPHEQVVVYGLSANSNGDTHHEADDTICEMSPRYYAEQFGYTFYATDVFEDVRQGKYYTIPVAWAYGRGVTNGKDATHFAPGDTCTRGQVVRFLWNAMGQPEPTLTECPFEDVLEGKYYYEAVLWALETGVTAGKDDFHFAPNESCTRGQVVTFIWNAMGKPEPTRTDCPFVDVTPGKYYYTAMLWALENGITAGLDETHFGPNQTCTRAQVVTFLYNALS